MLFGIIGPDNATTALFGVLIETIHIFRLRQVIILGLDEPLDFVFRRVIDKRHMVRPARIRRRRRLQIGRTRGEDNILFGLREYAGAVEDHHFALDDTQQAAIVVRVKLDRRRMGLPVLVEPFDIPRKRVGFRLTDIGGRLIAEQTFDAGAQLKGQRRFGVQRGEGLHLFGILFIFDPGLQGVHRAVVDKRFNQRGEFLFPRLFDKQLVIQQVGNLFGFLTIRRIHGLRGHHGALRHHAIMQGVLHLQRIGHHEGNIHI